MVKNLVSRLGKGIRKATLILSAGCMLTYGSCRLFNIRRPPTAILDVSPTSGNAPLESRIQLTGEDPDGKEDIMEYKILIDKNKDNTIDEEIIQDYPISITRTFNEDTLIKGICTDYSGLSDEDSIEIQVETTSPQEPPHESPPPEESGNNPPVITSDPVTEVNEGQGYYYDVNATDDEGNTLEYSLAPGSADWLKINSQTGEITGKAPPTSSDTSYQVIVEVSDGQDSVTQSYTLTIKNLVDISGRLEDNENDENTNYTGKKGLIKIYSASDQNHPIKEVVLMETDNGNFNFRVSDQPVDKFILQGAITNTSGNLESYVRTYTIKDDSGNIIKELDGTKDYNNLLIRVVPYPDSSKGEDFSEEDFRKHMEEVNIKPYHGLLKFEIPNVEILRDDPLRRGSYFEDGEQTNINNKASEWSYVISNAGGDVLNIQIDPFNPYGDPPENSDYHYTVEGDEIKPEMGWVIVVPNNDVGAGGLTWPYGSGTPCVIGKARIDLGIVTELITSHEFGHALETYKYHAQTLSADYTIMRGDSNTLTRPGPADKKAAYIVYENTYKARESLDDIMALEFLPGK